MVKRTAKKSPTKRRTRSVRAEDSAPPSPTDDFWYSPPHLPGTSSNVTPDSAMKVAAVYACVRVLSETIASLPLIVYRRLPNGGKERAVDHPLWGLLHDQPNAWQTSFEFREMMQGHVTLRGVNYAEIKSGERGAVDQLLPLHPDRVKPERLENGRLRFEVTGENGLRRYLTQDEVFRVPGLSFDGISGVSPIGLHRESIGLAMSLTEHGAALFENGSTLKVVLETDKKINPEARKQLRESWNAIHSGPRNAGKTAVLGDNLKVHELGLNNEDAQYLETRQFQVSDIARIFRVPPHLIGDLSKATFSNIEHQSIDFVVHTVRPWLVRWEQAIKRDLVVEDDVFVEFLVDGLLRGDAATRATALQTRFQNGNLSIDEWREIENQNPLEDDNGKRYFVQRNLIPVDKIDEELAIQQQKLAQPSPQPAEPADSESTPENAARQAFDVLIADCAERIAQAEIRELEERAGKADEDRDRFTAWSRDFYGKKHLNYAARMLAPVFRAFVVNVDATGLAKSLCDDSLNALGGADPSAVVTDWKETRASAVEAIIRKVIENEHAAAA